MLGHLRDLLRCGCSSALLLASVGLIMTGVVLLTGSYPLPAEQLEAYGCHVPGNVMLPQRALTPPWVAHPDEPCAYHVTAQQLPQ